MKPSLGRIVHFHDKVRRKPFAALIIEVFGNSVTLYVFYPFGPRIELLVPQAGTVAADELTATGTWDWPPRVES